MDRSYSQQNDPASHAGRDDLSEPLRSQRRLIWRIGMTAESRSSVSGNHVVRMGYSCRIVAEQMGLAPQVCENLFLAAPLHDIGFLGIPDVILTKRSELTPRESEIVRRHCEVGYRILSEELGPTATSGIGSMETCESGGMLEMAASIALAHHEKWDGRGYPQLLSGEQIPLEARIVAICDVFDSMTSRRPFREPYPESVALEAICSAAGKHFDPDVHEAFLAALPQIRSVKKQYLDQDQTALSEIWEAGELECVDDWQLVEV